MTIDAPPPIAPPAPLAESPSHFRWLTHPFWNTEERRLRAAWRFLLTFALMQLMGSGLRYFGYKMGGIALGPSFRSMAVTTIAVIIGALLLERRSLAHLGLRLDRAFWADTAAGSALGVLLIAGATGALATVGWMLLGPVTASLDLAALGHTLLIFICAGFFEEVFFRAWLLRTFADGLKDDGLHLALPFVAFVPLAISLLRGGRELLDSAPVLFALHAAAVVVVPVLLYLLLVRLFPDLRLRARTTLVLGTVLSSVLFGLGHAGNPGASTISGINIAVAGILLSLPFLITGRLGFSTGLHVMWNFAQGALFGLPVSGIDIGSGIVRATENGPDVWTGGVFGLEAGIIALLAMAVGCVLTVLWVRWHEGNVAIREDLLAPTR